MKLYTPHITVEDKIARTIEYANTTPVSEDGLENFLFARWSLSEDCEDFAPEHFNLIHTDWRRDGQEVPTYRYEEMPAVGIFAPGKDDDDERKIGASILPIDVTLSVVTRSGDATWAARTAKAGVGVLAQYLRELYAGSVPDSDDGISHIWRTLKIGEDITPPAYPSDRAWTGEAALKITVGVQTSF